MKAINLSLCRQLLLLVVVVAFAIPILHSQTRIQAIPVTSGDSCLVQYSIVTPDTVVILYYKDLNGTTVPNPANVRFGNCSAYVPDFCLIEKLKNHA